MHSLISCLSSQLRISKIGGAAHPLYTTARYWIVTPYMHTFWVSSLSGFMNYDTMHSFLFSRNYLPDSDSVFFNNIILYTPAAGRYLRRPMKKASRKQLINKLAMKGF